MSEEPSTAGHGVGSHKKEYDVGTSTPSATTVIRCSGQKDFACYKRQVTKITELGRPLCGSLVIIIFYISILMILRDH